MGAGVSSKLESKLEKIKERKTKYLQTRRLISEEEENSLGLEFIKESKIKLLVDIQLSGDYLEDIYQKVEKRFELPETMSHIMDGYHEMMTMFKKKYKKILDKRYLNICDEEEADLFLDCELLYPLLSKNKRIFMYLILEKIKDFISKIELWKLLDLQKAIKFIEINFEKVPFSKILKSLYSKMNDEKNPNFMYEVLEEQEEDHIQTGYKIFKLNLTRYLKLIIFFFEKTSLYYKILTPNEHKINYKIAMANIYFLIEKNLERKNYTIFKYWECELKRIVGSLNLLFNDEKVKKLFQTNRDSFSNFMKDLKSMHLRIKNEILNCENDAEEMLLFKPVREKYKRMFEKLVSYKVPRFYNNYFLIKKEIDDFLNEELYDYFYKDKSLFDKKKMYLKAKKKAKKDKKYYDKIVMDLFILVVFKQSVKYSQRYNLRIEEKDKIIRNFCEAIHGQVESYTSNRVDIIKKRSSEKSPKLLIEYLVHDFKMCIKEYNEDSNMTISLHLYLIFCLFMIFSNFKKVGDNSRYVHVEEKGYQSSSRTVLFSICKDLKNYEFGFHNWDIVKRLEKKVVEFLEKASNQGDINLRDGIEEVKYSEEYHDLIRNGKSEEMKEKLIEHKNRLEKYLKFSMSKDFDLDAIASKFVMEEIFDQKFFNNIFFKFEPFLNQSKKKKSMRKSKNIIIIISGVTNLTEDSQKIWGKFASNFENSEIYSFKWPSIIPEDLEEADMIIKASIGKNNQRRDLFTLGDALFSQAHVNGLSLNTHNMKHYHKSLYHYATMCGKALAFFLGEMNIFEKCCVTLVGFSTGSIVAYNCLRDLYLMRKSEQIYNFVSIGGLISKNELNAEIIKLFPGYFYNFYSLNDRILKYNSNLRDEYTDPCGLTKITFDSYLHLDMNVEVYNLDMSENIHNHRDYLLEENLDIISNFIQMNERNGYIMHQTVGKNGIM